MNGQTGKRCEVLVVRPDFDGSIVESRKCDLQVKDTGSRDREFCSHLQQPGTEAGPR